MTGTTKPLLSVLALALFVAAPLRGEEPIRYEVRFPNADHHEAEVTVTFPDLDVEVLELRMSRSSPGRYALHEFAKNVYRFRATNGAGEELEVVRPDPHQWNVSGHDGTVVVRYTVFGDQLDGTYLAIDDTHAHMNVPATFLWARGLDGRPIRLTVVPLRDHWKVATQLATTDEENVFTAEKLDYFLDSPTEVGPLQMYEWTVPSGGRDQRVRLALHHQGTQAQGRAFADLARLVVREQMAIFGELPRFDYGTYTFIADYLPYADGDGMEHRNSTVLTSTRTLEDPVGNLGTLSHEFFHSWNVERLRPLSLEPFDFERANMSGELWFAEGFTSYYDDLTLKRAGITSLDRYARDLTGSLDSIVNAPGRRIFSPIEMSQQAPFVDAAVSVDPSNRENTFASYYPYGAVLALGLDLSIRESFPGKSLDDYMRAMWETHGKTEMPYTLADLERVLGETTSPSFARDYFESYIREGELPDFERLLALAGLELTRPRAGRAWLGGRVSSSGVVDSRPLVGSPLYEAGADAGDRVLEIGGKDVGEALESFEPGDVAEMVFEKRGGERRRARIRFRGDPALEVVTFERAGREVTEAVALFREAWLSSRQKELEKVALAVAVNGG